MFLKKLLRALFGAKKKGMAVKKAPYTLTYSNKEIRFFTPNGLRWARKWSDTLHPRAIEERKEVFRWYDKKTIQDLINLDLNIAKPEPVYPN